MYSSTLRIHAFRLRPGQDLKRDIQAYVDQANIQAGWIITCVGSLTDYHLRFANQDHGSHGQGHFEIVSLVGTLGVHGSHVHVSLSDGVGQTIGGHLLDGNVVYTTAELVIGEATDLVFRREVDEETGWRELGVDRKAPPHS